MPEDKVTFAFKWISTLPDQRQYKQNSQILEPVDATVCVEVPVEAQYIYNAEAIKVAILDGKAKKPMAILTPKGMAYCIDQLEKFLQPVEMTVRNEFKADDWEADAKEDSWEEDNENEPIDEKWEESDEDWEN